MPRQSTAVIKRPLASYKTLAAASLIGLLFAIIPIALKHHVFGLFYSPDDWWADASKQVSAFDLAVNRDRQYPPRGLTSSLANLQKCQRKFRQVDAPKEADTAKAQILTAMDETVNCYVQSQSQGTVSHCPSAKAAWSSAEAELDRLQLKHDEYSAAYD